MTMTPAASGRTTPVRPTTPNNSGSNTPGITQLDTQVEINGQLMDIPMVIGELTLTSAIHVSFQPSDIAQLGTGSK
jgi:hypothetical protein